MGRLIGLAAVIAGLVALIIYYGPEDPGFDRGARWALGPGGFFFYSIAGLVGFMAAHRSGKALTLAPILFVAVGAIFVLLEAWSLQIPNVARIQALVIFALGLAVAYGPKPPEWLPYGSAALGGGLAGYFAANVLGARLLELSVLGGFFTSLAIFILGGLFVAELCNRFKNGASVRTRLGAGAAGVGLYLALRLFGVIPSVLQGG